MGYGTVSRLFHWVTVVLVLVMIPAGLVMIQDIPRPLQDKLFILHKGLGPVVFVVVVLRLAWRGLHPPPPLPADIPALQRRAAGLVHAGLYVFLLVQTVSGYVRVTTGGFPLEFLRALGIPPLLPKAEGVSRVAESVHAVSVTVLIALICAHVGAAAYHGLVRRDGVVSRMWPPIARA
jgi:cytochrome b561